MQYRPYSLLFFAVVLQCVAVCCNVLQCVQVHTIQALLFFAVVLQCVSVCCKVLQCVQVHTTQALLSFALVLQCVAVCCSVLYCVAVCPGPYNTGLTLHSPRVPYVHFICVCGRVGGLVGTWLGGQVGW